MRISSFSAVSILLVMPLGCGSEATDGDDLTAGSGGAPAHAGSMAGPAGSGGKSGAGGAVSGGAGGRDGSGGGAGGSSAAGAAAGGKSGGGGVSGSGMGGSSAGTGGGVGGSGATGGTGGGEAGSAGSPGAGGGASGGSGRGGQGGGGKAGMSGAGGKATAGSGGALATCTAEGNITYTLAESANPTAQEQMAYDRITAAMDRALEYYNCYTDISRALNISYVPSVPTADGNPNGSIRFGSTASMNYITAMHETSHVLGVGDNAYDRLIVDGVFTGPAATAEIRAITGDPTAEIHGDNQHFWPYGLNYESEVMSEADLLNHMRIVVAIREDIGL
jgi:hypothetical protein